MADYGIDININMGGSGGNFQTLIDSVNNLNASFQKVGTAATTAGRASKDSFSESMAIMSQYGNSMKKVVSEIDSLKKQILEKNEALRKGRISETQHKADIDKLHASMKSLQTAQRQYNSLLGQTTVQASNASKAVNGLTSTFNKLGAVLGISFGLYGVIRLMTNSVKTIAEFDLAQKKLQSVLGETSEGMKELSQSAIDVGKNSIFGAKGVSELQIELAKMGFTKNEIMAMQGAINDLAIATQEDLAGSAEVVANIIKTFELTATETRDVVNVMGKAFNDSALGLSNFRESIKYVAPVAKQAGLSFRETVAALELLSNAGLKGSLAGTGLNNVLKAMMDSNSKLSKSLGGTVSGWDGFTSVLQRAREEGWNMQDVFGLITQRATGAFSTFMEGLPTLDEMSAKLQDVSNVMRDQMLVQMDSISYQAKVTKSAWEALILSFDSGDQVISRVIKTALQGFQKWFILIGGDRGTITKSLVDQTIDIKNALSLEGLDENTGKELEKYETLLQNMAAEAATMSANEMGNNLQNINNLIASSGELLSATIVKAADQRIKSLKIEGKDYKEFEAARNAAILSIGFEMDALEKAGKRNTIQFKVLAEALEKIDKMNFKRLDEITPKGDDDAKKAISDRYKLELEMLKLQQQIEAEKIKLATDGYMEEMLLEDSLFKFKKLIAAKELERDIALGEDKVKVTELYHLQLQRDELDHRNKMIAIGEKMDKESLKNLEESLKENYDATKKSTEDLVDYVISEQKRLMEAMQFMDKFQQDEPILSFLFGKGLEGDLLAGIISEDEITAFADAWNTAFDSIGESLSSYADSWEEATDRIVDSLNRQIDEAQSALDTEVELLTAGYANNVALKRKELEDLKKAREEALADQKAAQKAQAAIDTVTQLTSLITAAAQIFKSFSAIPIVGTGLAIGVIAAMFTAFTAAKVKAAQVAGIAKYEEGGWIGGRRHSQGGTHIEAERGEFVVNRKSAMKHKSLIEAVNEDNKYELNRIYLNNLKGQIINAKVSLDDSKDLRAIRQMMERPGKSVEYADGYKIVKFGNTTTKIRLN